MAESFPRQYARTQRFTLGRPRNFTVSLDGERVAFLRSKAGDDAVTCLWLLTLATGDELLVTDPRRLAGDEEDLTPEERLRRERARESAGGIVSYSCDPELRMAAFALSGRLFTADLTTGQTTERNAPPGVYDPRVDPSGTRVAYTAAGRLYVDGREVAGDDDPNITWGLAEFIAAEEMDRHRGFWWSPDGSALVACRVDTSPVQRWYIGDPADPSASPTEVAYPAAGTDNADVSLWQVGLDSTPPVEIEWDRESFPYLAAVTWNTRGPLTLLVQARDQKTHRVVTPDGVVEEQTDPSWVDIVEGVPDWTTGGDLVMTAVHEGSRVLTVKGQPVTPPGMQVRQVVAVDPEIVVMASEVPEVVHVYRVSDTAISAVTEGHAVCSAVAGGGRLLITRAPLEGAPESLVLEGPHIASRAEVPVITPAPGFTRSGERQLSMALLLPRDQGDGPWPVVLDPYGGPGAQRVLWSQYAYLTPQWLADQGFAVLIADGRGTPGRGPAWEREVAGDLATAPLEDQVDALHAAAEADRRLDLSRVAIRGWSFGGYLAALAVLRRPDVFHAAIAGAPVTDWRLYDTHYTERFLGHPDEQPDAYRRSSVIEDAARLERPLLLIHGLADDNVVAAHTLQLSSALLEAGRPHRVLPLSGVTHMTPQEVVAENLLLLQVAFLKEALGI